MTPQFSFDSPLSLWHAALVLGPVLSTGCAALIARPGAATASAWRASRFAANSGLCFAALSLLVVLAGQSGTGLWLRADAAGALMMLLVAFVGWVIVRYSQPYLNGEREERHYVRWLMATLASVSLVVATNNVAVLVAAWTASSLALHRLLVFFSARPPAIVAAHKKFIVGRAADLCMLAAAALLYSAFETFQIDRIMAEAARAAAQPFAVQAATLLIVAAALLKCAQLPFHGWLIQVMEAPTPVSAFLHAGVVNLGGFVLIRFAPLVNDLLAAQALLVMAGAATAVLAALVMTTRISIKVMLAWSTCAQMGFMLMECGLGAWDMALLHLLAHSLYKAHAFLSAGGAVRRTQLDQLTPQAATPGALALAVGALMGVATTLAAGSLAGSLFAMLLPTHAAASPGIWVLAGILALALVPLVHGQSLRLGGWWLPVLGLSAFGTAFAYFALHAVFSTWVLPSAAATPTALWVTVAVAFSLLFLMQSVITVAPRSAVVRGLYPFFFGGLFLDEKFSRLAFRLWGPPVPTVATTPLPLADAGTAFDTATTGAH